MSTSSAIHDIILIDFISSKSTFFFSVTQHFAMATLNLSTNGPSISKSYQTVVNATLPNSPASSPTYAQWAVFSVSSPLVNVFQQDSGNKESVLKVQSSGGWFSIVSIELV